MSKANKILLADVSRTGVWLKEKQLVKNYENKEE